MVEDMNIDLITFKIGDIFRCKCLSRQSEILRIYNYIKEIGENGSLFRVCRIKDRLNLDTRDILINISFMDKILAEIQLAVIEDIDVKQSNYDRFNHFLYELKRANFGPIMESACIWSHLDQRSKFYKKSEIMKSESTMSNSMVKQHKC